MGREVEGEGWVCGLVPADADVIEGLEGFNMVLEVSVGILEG